MLYYFITGLWSIVPGRMMLGLGSPIISSESNESILVNTFAWFSLSIHRCFFLCFSICHHQFSSSYHHVTIFGHLHSSSGLVNNFLFIVKIWNVSIHITTTTQIIQNTGRMVLKNLFKTSNCKTIWSDDFFAKEETFNNKSTQLRKILQLIKKT